MEPPPVRAVLVKPPSQPREAQRVYSAPRRFGIGTMLWVATACGVLIWVLQLFDTPAPVIIAISIFLAVVAGMQAVFQESPRWASIITGEICVVGCFGYFMVVALLDSRGGPGACILCSLPVVMGFGLVAGYCGGAVVAGFFMVMENAGNYFAERRKPKEEPVSVWDREDDA